MATSRLNLHAKLVQILGSENVYFQPPTNLRMCYPCVVYELNRIDSIYASDKNYMHHPGYTVTLIHKKPDNEFVDKLFSLPYCRFDRAFVNDNLYHYVYTIYNV